MYIILLTYRVPLTTVDKYLDLHVEYLKEQYKFGNFIASGRRVPRTGGVIFSNIGDVENLKTIIEKDPFKHNKVADYEIIEFVPSMTSEDLAFLIPKSSM